MRYGIVLIMIGIAWCVGVRVRSHQATHRFVGPTDEETLVMAARQDPMVFDHCNFQSLDLVRALRDGQTVMLTGTNDGPMRFTVPKGKIVVFKILPSIEGDRTK